MRKKMKRFCLTIGVIIVGLLFVGCGAVRAFNSPDILAVTITTNIPNEDAIHSLSSKVPRSGVVPPEALETEQLLKNLVIIKFIY